LVDVAQQSGVAKAFLVQRGADVAQLDLSGVSTLGLTAGASAPEVLVEEILDALRLDFDVTVNLEVVREENVIFNVPLELRDVV
jgi:4-hydroxy-3-methylbut-2-enyl diphosphate reductase